MATLFLRNKQSVYKWDYTSAVEGYPAFRPPSTPPNQCELSQHVLKSRLFEHRPAKLQYDIIEVRNEMRGRRYGIKEGHWGKDFCGKYGQQNNGRDAYIFLRIHVPGVSSLLKSLIEGQDKIYSNPSDQFSEFTKDRCAEVELPRRYYVEISELPDWAQISLKCEGECTLPPHIAYPVIRRRLTGEPDQEIFKALHD